MFRRDLRLQDNTAFTRCCEETEKVLPVFIFDPVQIDNKHNEYFSRHAFQFMIGSLEALDEDLKSRGSALSFFTGKPAEVLAQLVTNHDFDAVYFNKDHTPYARNRDEKITNVVTDAGAEVIATWDALLTEPGTVSTQDDTPYKVFTSFKNTAAARPPQKPQIDRHQNLYSDVFEEAEGIMLLHKMLPEKDRSETLAQTPGRDTALRTLRNVDDFAHYDEERDFPAADATTHLSGHLKFGTVSPREVYWRFRDAFGKDHGVITELYWRDFYAHLLFFFPELLGNEMNEKYADIKWRRSRKDFETWQQGKTGFPIVDAAMRQLWEIGWMHNRVRMIVASFLTKDLLIGWWHGARWFWDTLVDGNLASNTMGWQWSAGSGADAQPFFRIFNPVSQGERHDPNGDYVRRWIPELADLPAEHIHQPWNAPDHVLSDANVTLGETYPTPIVDHSEMRDAAMAEYDKVR